MSIYIQDPTHDESPSLQEVLIEACQKANRGGGAFAFITQAGIQLLLEDETFIEFLNKGDFYLVLGIDGVTNRRSLERILQLRDNVRGLRVSAFLHDEGGSIFHPKFTWFRINEGGLLIVGSANLTARGLRRNWEAFCVTELNPEQMVEIERTWEDWCIHNAERLKSIDAHDVLERADKNVFRRRKAIHRILFPETDRGFDSKSAIDPEEFHPEDEEAWIFDDKNIVLLAEIPRGGDRWNQANFDIQTFTKFFGAVPGNNSMRILLRSIDETGRYGGIENRPSVSVKSRNFRFELEAAAGLEYPDNGRPIGVFIKVTTRMFLYMLSMPGGAYHEALSIYLDRMYDGRLDRVKRIQATVNLLREECEELPFWNLDIFI